jgi:ATP-dependent protease ClpP protease subunit
MTKPTASLVLGGGHSIGVPLAVAAKRSFIAPSAAMTIHPVRLTGVIIGVPQTWTYLSKIQERIIRFVTNNSNISREYFLNLMMRTEELANDVGSVIEGNEAVVCGLIDQLGGLSDALEYLHGEIRKNREKNAPQDGGFVIQ